MTLWATLGPEFGADENKSLPGSLQATAEIREDLFQSVASALSKTSSSSLSPDPPLKARRLRRSRTFLFPSITFVFSPSPAVDYNT